MKEHQRGTNNINSNPCYNEQELSLKCFDRHNYDKEKCFFEIENYRECKKFWGEVRRSRRIKGIYPLLPPLAEREEIKKEFLRNKSQ